MLAPLFDRMTTHDLTRRFTADEALEFFQNEYSQLTEEQLGCHTYYDSDRSSSECWDWEVDERGKSAGDRGFC